MGNPRRSYRPAPRAMQSLILFCFCLMAPFYTKQLCGERSPSGASAKGIGVHRIDKWRPFRHGGPPPLDLPVIPVGADGSHRFCRRKSNGMDFPRRGRGRGRTLCKAALKRAAVPTRDRMRRPRFARWPFWVPVADLAGARGLRVVVRKRPISKGFAFDIVNGFA